MQLVTATNAISVDVGISQRTTIFLLWQEVSWTLHRITARYGEWQESRVASQTTGGLDLWPSGSTGSKIIWLVHFECFEVVFLLKEPPISKCLGIWETFNLRCRVLSLANIMINWTISTVVSWPTLLHLLLQVLWRDFVASANVCHNSESIDTWMWVIVMPDKI